MNGSPSFAAWMPRHITWKLIGSNCLLWNSLTAEQKDDVFLAGLSFVWFFKALKVGKSKILWKSWHDPAISSPFNQPIKILQSSLESIFILQLVICLVVLKDLSRKRLCFCWKLIWEGTGSAQVSVRRLLVSSRMEGNYSLSWDNSTHEGAWESIVMLGWLVSLAVSFVKQGMEMEELEKFHEIACWMWPLKLQWVVGRGGGGRRG